MTDLYYMLIHLYSSQMRYTLHQLLLIFKMTIITKIFDLGSAEEVMNFIIDNLFCAFVLLTVGFLSVNFSI